MNEQSRNKTSPARYVDPFTSFRSEMDRLFHGFFGDRGVGMPMPAPARAGADIIVPSVDIKETDKAIILTAELPGMDEKSVDLSVNNGVLTLRGEKTFEHQEDKDNVYVMERRYGSFQRSFHVPDNVDDTTIEATVDKGVLTVTMPKKPGAPAGERKIAISA